jgi:tetratricopeptide (TPR) repeat protein
MSNFDREVQLQELSSQEIRDLRYDVAGKLVIIPSDSNIEQQSTNFLRKLTISERADLKIALYWLNDYEPESDATQLEQVRGYLEGFHHLCELSAWKEAARLLFICPTLEQPNITVSSSSNRIRDQELHKQLQTWGYFRQAIELYSPLLSKLDADLDCTLLQGLGRSNCFQGQLQRSIEYHQQQLNLAREISNRKLEAQALAGLNLAYLRQGQHQTAMDYSRKSLVIAREIGDREDEALALNCLGQAYGILGEVQKAMKYHLQALAISRKIGNQELEEKCLDEVITTYGDMGQSRLGIDYVQQQLQIGKQTGNRYQIYSALTSLGKLYFLSCDYQKSLEYLSQALTIIREIGDLYQEQYIQVVLVALYARWGKYQS